MEKENQLVTLCFDLQLWLFESDVYLGKENSRWTSQPDSSMPIYLVVGGKNLHHLVIAFSIDVSINANISEIASLVIF